MESKRLLQTARSRKCRDHLDLWKLLRRNRKLQPLEFTEYTPIGHFTVEFCSINYRIIVETETFSDLIEEDHSVRDMYLRKEGYTILRYRSLLIRDFPSIIVEDIYDQSRELRLR
ncbi:MAG: DUF559 domain-containing protein [Cyclobacteriaceae bacterium]